MVIVFLSDFGLEDEYVGVVKCVIKSINPDVTVIDLTHNIPPQDIASAVFIIEKSKYYLPENSVLLAVVDPGVGGKRNPCAGEAYINGKRIMFVGPDNGIFTPLFEKKFRCMKIDTAKLEGFREWKRTIRFISNTFHGRDIFGPVAGLLAKGVSLESLCSQEIEPVRYHLPEPTLKDKTVLGNVVYIDRFGNLITNIPRELVKSDNVKVKIKDRVILGISKSYDEVDEGQLLAIWGSYNTLEISVRNGNARKLINPERFERVEVAPAS